MATSGRPDNDSWWTSAKGKVWERLMPYVERLERQQSETYDRFAKLSYLYDPYSPAGRLADSRSRESRDADGIMQENLIASNCDAIAGSIASVEVKARFLTDGASWSVQRRARKLDHYAEGLSKLLDLDELIAEAFHAGSLKGTGVIHIYVDAFDQIKAEHVQVDDIIVNESACRGGNARQVQRRMVVPREILAAQYPAHKKAIEDAQTSTKRAWKKWAGYKTVSEDEIPAVWSWILPIGTKGHKNYVPGREVLSINGADLVDNEWDEPRFPLAVFKWTKRPDGWYGIGGAERILGHQRKLNKRNLQHDRIIDQYAFPITYVRLADANIGVKTVNRLGTVAYYKADPPKTVVPPSVPAESFKDREDTKSSGFEEFGQSRMAVSAMKPPGIDSGIAMREYRDQTTQRFAGQEKGHERLKMDCVWLAIWCAKKLGAKAPTVVHKSRFGERRIKWGQVDMGDVKLMLEPASRLGRTPAGRTQFVMEMAQAGIISQESSKRLLMPNAPLDVEAEMSAYIEAAEDIDACIEEIEDGRELVPEPYQALSMGVWRMQVAYLRDKRAGAPESVLEGLRQWIEIADYELGLQEQEAANANMAAPPAEAAPQAALADQAMQLRAV